MVQGFALGEALNHVQHEKSYRIAPFEASLRDAPQGEFKMSQSQN